MRPPVSPRAFDAFKIICDRYKSDGQPIKLAQIANDMNVSRARVWQLVKDLRDAGYLAQMPRSKSGMYPIIEGVQNEHANNANAIGTPPGA